MRDNIVSYPIEVSLRLIGIWPGSPNPAFCQLSWMTLILTTQCFQYWNVISHLGTKDVAGLMEGFVLAVTDTVILNRVFLLCLNTRVVQDILGTMSEDWKEGTCGKWQFETMTRKAELAYRFANGIVLFYLFGAAIFGCGILCIEYGSRNDSNVYGERILLKTLFPIEVEYSPMREFLIIEQFVQQVLIVTLTSSTTALMISLTLHADGQIDIIRKQLSDMILTREKPGYVRTCLKIAIRKHQKVIDFCDNIEKVFTYMALMVFVVIALLFGCVWFILSVSTDVTMQVMFVLYYMCIVFDVLVYCKIGEYFREKSLAVGQAAFETVWYDFDHAECQMILLLLLRSQKRLTITVGKFVDLSIELFANTIKTSVSIVSLFLAVY